jgi:hypothetical protein
MSQLDSEHVCWWSYKFRIRIRRLSSFYRYLGTYPVSQCCRSGMFIPDPNFFYPGSRVKKIRIPNPGSASKNLIILTQKIVSKLSKI